MDRNVEQDEPLDVIRKHTLEARAMELREGGKTFREIGALLGVTAQKARYLYLRAARRDRKPTSWTDGLNERLANSLRWLGFQSPEDVTAALKSGHLAKLSSFERGLRGSAIAELTQWLGLADEPGIARCESGDESAFIIPASRDQRSNGRQ